MPTISRALKPHRSTFSITFSTALRVADSKVDLRVPATTIEARYEKCHPARRAMSSRVCPPTSTSFFHEPYGSETQRKHSGICAVFLRNTFPAEATLSDSSERAVLRSIILPRVKSWSSASEPSGTRGHGDRPRRPANCSLSSGRLCRSRSFSRCRFFFGCFRRS